MEVIVKNCNPFFRFIRTILLGIIIFSLSTGITLPVLSYQIGSEIEKNLALANELEMSFNTKTSSRNSNSALPENDSYVVDSKTNATPERSENIQKSSNIHSIKSQEAIISANEYQVNLVSGWNLISLPIDPSNKSITSVLNSIDGKYLSVWAYGQSGWERYIVGAPGNTLATMEPGRGYWVNMTQSATLTVTGSENFDKAVNLKKGWNLVGYNSLTQRTREEALLSIEGLYYSVWTYINGQWVRYITSASGNTLTNMEPWRGYWINTSQDCVWELETGPDIIRPEVTIEIQPDPSTPPLVGENVTITVSANDNIGVVSKTLKVNNVNVPLDQTGKAVYTSNVPGVFTAVAEASDEAGNRGRVSKEFKFLSGVNSAPPAVSINTPEDNSKIFSPTNIIGTASDSDLVRYKLEYSIKGQNEFIVFASGTSSVTNGILGNLDPTMLRNGLYDIKLTAEDASGNKVSATVTYQLDGEMKVGNFTLSFTDLLIPVSGIPIKITRTYDSRDKSIGDFGFGWKMDIKNIQLNESVVMGTGWEENRIGFNNYTLEPTKPHYVTVTYPDGKVDEFAMYIDPDAQSFVPITYTTASFVAKAGTYSTLTALANNNLYVLGSIPGEVELVDDSTFDTYNPRRYRLTLTDGTIYTINKTSGLESIVEPNGNQISFGPNGITHSTGKGVTFTRDAQGRITEITDPMGNKIKYKYDFYGDLIEVKDRENFTTKYKYNSVHGLIEYINPNGELGVRSEYDDNGRLIRITNSAGRTVNFTSNLNTRQEVITDFDGNVTVTEYNENGNVVRVTDPLGGVTTHTYDANGNQISTTNALGHTINRTFDDRGNKLTETDPLGNTTTYTYNSANKPLTIKDANGNTTSFTYDSKGNLLSRTNALGVVDAQYSYDSNGNVVSFTNANGLTTNYEYDTYGNITAVVDPDGNRKSYVYNANGDIISDTDVEGNTINTVYDKRGLAVQKIDALGRISRFEYGPTGQISAVIDPMGNTVQRITDGRGNEIKTIDPLGNIFERQFDAKDNLIKQIDPLGNATSYEYDVFDRLKKTIYPDGSFTTIEYDLIGRPIKKSDANGNVWEYLYDAGGRNTKIIDPLGNETTFEYDAVGNLIKQTDALGNVFSFTYDSLNNLSTITFPNGTSQSYEYDAGGRVIKETDPSGRIKRFEYDYRGNITKVIDPEGNETIYTYDQSGNILTQKDAENRITRYEYSSNGLLTKTIYPDGSFKSYDYDNLYNMTSTRDPNNNIIQMQYNELKMLTKKTYPDGKEIIYTYTPTGKINTFTDSLGTTSYTYDNRDRIIRVDNPDGSSIRYTYDGVGNITSTITQLSASSTSYTTTYTYDKLNRLKSVTDPDGRVTTYEYDANGNRIRIDYPNSTYTLYSYDNLNRLTEIEHKKGANVLERYTYTLNAVGDRTKVISLDGSSVEYTYDNLRRLVREIHKDSSNVVTLDISYTYDKVGNRLTKTDNLSSNVINYTYDVNDRLLSAGAITYTYDNNGNMISQTESGITILYEYDYENRLIKVTKPGGDVTNYIYDANGALVKETKSSGSVSYLVDANNNTGYAQILVEYNSVNKSIIVFYVYGDDLISQKRSNVVHFYHYDGNNNTRFLTDINGNITDRYSFDAFGIPIFFIVTIENRYLYSAERYDPNSGFYYLRARFYSPQNGRFITRDLLDGKTSDPMSLHKYLYANANPIYYFDPSGQFSISESIIVSAIINVTFSIVLDVLGGKSAGEIVVNAIIAGIFGSLTAGASGLAVKQVVSRITSEIVKKGLVLVVIPIVKASITTIMWALQTETQMLFGTASSHPSIEDISIVFFSSLIIELLFLKFFSYDKMLQESMKQHLSNKKIEILKKLNITDVFETFRKKGMSGLNNGISISKKQLNNIAKTMLKKINEDVHPFGAPSVMQGVLDTLDNIVILLSQLLTSAND